MIRSALQQTGFRQFLDAAADAMLVVDVRGKVVALNPEAARLFGWTETELLGGSLDRVISPRFQQATRSQQPAPNGDSGIARKGVPVSLFARRKDGTEFPAEFNHSPLDSGEDALVLVTIRDLTRERRTQTPCSGRRSRRPSRSRRSRMPSLRPTSRKRSPT